MANNVFNALTGAQESMIGASNALSDEIRIVGMEIGELAASDNADLSGGLDCAMQKIAAYRAFRTKLSEAVSVWQGLTDEWKELRENPTALQTQLVPESKPKPTPVPASPQSEPVQKPAVTGKDLAASILAAAQAQPEPAGWEPEEEPTLQGEQPQEQFTSEGVRVQRGEMFPASVESEGGEEYSDTDKVKRFIFKTLLANGTTRQGELPRLVHECMEAEGALLPGDTQKLTSGVIRVRKSVSNQVSRLSDRKLLRLLNQNISLTEAGKAEAKRLGIK